MQKSIINLVKKLNRYKGINLILDINKIEKISTWKIITKYTITDWNVKDTIDSLLIYGMNAKYTYNALKNALKYIEKENFDYVYKDFMKTLDPYYYHNFDFKNA